MTTAEKIAAVLRECGAVNAWLDDSAQDGGWQVDSSDAWYRETAEAVLEALEVQKQGRGHSCPRCGAKRSRGHSQVCAACAAEMGWDPECRACLLADAGKDATGVQHVGTCGVRQS